MSDLTYLLKAGTLTSTLGVFFWSVCPPFLGALLFCPPLWLDPWQEPALDPWLWLFPILWELDTYFICRKKIDTQRWLLGIKCNSLTGFAESEGHVCILAKAWVNWTSRNVYFNKRQSTDKADMPGILLEILCLYCYLLVGIKIKYRKCYILVCKILQHIVKSCLAITRNTQNWTHLKIV